MEQKRRRFFNKAQERRERLERIAATSPPAPSTVLEDEDDAMDTDTLEPDDDVQAAEAIDAALPKKRPRAPFSINRPAHRQPAPSGDTRESWWTSAPREDFGQTAEQRRAEMEKGKAAKSVVGRINE